MTAEKRTPGPVTEEARPVNNRGFDSRQEDRAQTTPRVPGQISEATEAVSSGESFNNNTGGAPDYADLAESSRWKIVFILLVCTATVLVLTEVVATLVRAYQEQVVWIWLPLLVLTLGFLVAVVWAGSREWQAARSVDALADRETQIRSMLKEQNLSGLQDVLAPTIENLRRRTPTLIREFEAAAVERETPQDYLRQFDNIVLAQLDLEAQGIIKKCVLTGSLAVAVSPHPALDSLMVLWRAKVLIRSIGEIYGLQPTGFSVIRLIRHAITSAMITAALEKTGEIAVTQAAQNVALKAFKPLAEGATTAVRLYRLGKITQQVCRPVPVANGLELEAWAEKNP